MKETIESLTVKQDLCVSCGICAGACPQQCIHFKKDKGQYLPHVEQEKCIKCGLCAKVCSSSVNGEDYERYTLINGGEWNAEEFLWGSSLVCYSAYCRDSKLRNIAVSGGVTSALVSGLLKSGQYDAAFLVSGHSYEEQVISQKFTDSEYISENIAKSRYVPVSHEKLIRYMLKYTHEKLVITATPCAIHGILRCIELFQLQRSNYLLIGLFCDKCERDSIVDYFRRFSSKEIKKFYFRSKDENVWPGMVKVEYMDGSEKMLPAEKRMQVKEFFQLKRCLYCLDKLNQFADISIGDDYTNYEESSSVNGKNLVIIRTKEGDKAFAEIENSIVFKEISIEEVKRAQGIKKRQQNCAYIAIAREQMNLEWYPDVKVAATKEDRILYDKICRNIQLGETYPKSSNVIRLKNEKRQIINLFRRIKNRIKG